LWCEAARRLSLAEIVQDAVKKREPGAEGRGVHLMADTGEGMPFVRADLALIERALDNLTDNALQHTPRRGRVALSIRRFDGFAAIDVSDTGVGIAPEHQGQVFDRFYRAPGVAKGEGSGLGLEMANALRNCMAIATARAYLDVAPPSADPQPPPEAKPETPRALRCPCPPCGGCCDHRCKRRPRRRRASGSCR
jgi:light-regulated signal transduction histidine kinase (bacteriophytochrome)